MHVTFIARNYPTLSRPSYGTFVQQFVLAMARQGHECSVINPISFFDRKYGALPPRFSIENAGEAKSVAVYRPRYTSFSSLKLGPFNTGRWSNAMFTRASLRAMAKLRQTPTVIYGHFMYPAGYTAVCCARKRGLPSVVGVGEGEFWTLVPVGERRASQELKNATAFLAVSTCIAETLETRLSVSSEKIAVFPNGIDLRSFRPCTDRQALFKKLRIPADTFNIGYVGPFIEQKGYPQLRAAVERLEGVKLILMGRGTPPPSNPQIAYAGTVAHSRVAEYLGICDIFVLPTAIEGSCNSVIEAMGCGLPIITSNGRHMDDIVDDDVAIRVDHSSVGAIREAILTLKNNPVRRQKMSEACLRRVKKFDINERARCVSAWMEDLVRKGQS